METMRRTVFLLLCLLGVLVCCYAYYVETAKQNDADFTAACDISMSVSCSKVFASKCFQVNADSITRGAARKLLHVFQAAIYGKGFGLVEHIVGRTHWLNQPNSVFGLAFYILQLVFEHVDSPGAATTQVILSCAANVGSVYLAYILYFILEDLCLVCVTSYIINAAILLCNWFRMNQHRTMTKHHTS